MLHLRRFLSISALAATLFLASSASAADDGQPRSMETTQPCVSETQALEIRAFFKQCLKINDVTTLERIGGGRPSTTHPNGLMRVIVDRQLETKGGLVQLSSQGKVLDYVRGGDFLEELGASERRIDEAISEDAAWESIKPVLTYHDLPLKKQEYAMTLVDTANLKGEGDLYGAAWEIKKNFFYQGRPCRNSRITLLVSASSGNLWAMHYSPVQVPEKTVKRISEAEAILEADHWLANHAYFEGKTPRLSVSPSNPVQEVVAQPNTTWVLEGEAHSDGNPSSAYFCWEVPFEFVERDNLFTGRLWIRVDTGMVIGGSERDS